MLIQWRRISCVSPPPVHAATTVLTRAAMIRQLWRFRKGLQVAKHFCPAALQKYTPVSEVLPTPTRTVCATVSKQSNKTTTQGTENCIGWAALRFRKLPSEAWRSSSSEGQEQSLHSFQAVFSAVPVRPWPSNVQPGLCAIKLGHFCCARLGGRHPMLIAPAKCCGMYGRRATYKQVP